MNKLIAKALGIASLATAVTAFALPHDDMHSFKIGVDADHKKGAHIFIDTNGEKFEKSIPIEALHDEQQLADLLVDVPEEKREKVLAAIGKIAGDFKSKEFHIAHGEGAKVVVIDVEEEHLDGEVSEVIKKVVRLGGDHKVIEVMGDNKGSVDLLVKLIESGEYSADDLNKRQQALDKKR